MSLDAVLALSAVVFIGIVWTLAARQLRVYRGYEAAQLRVIERQEESLAVQRASLENQKEIVRLLQVIASQKGRDNGA